MAVVSSLRSWTHIDPNGSPQNVTPKRSYSPSVSINALVASEVMPRFTTSSAASIQSRKSDATAQQRSAAAKNESSPEQRAGYSSRHSSHNTEGATHERRDSGSVDLSLLLRLTRDLGGKVNTLRSIIWERCWLLQSMERTRDEEEQTILKALRILVADSDPQSVSVEVDRQLLSNTTRILSGQRDEKGPLQDEIRQLQQELDIAEYRLQSTHEELRRGYLLAEQQATGHGGHVGGHVNFDVDSETSDGERREDPVPNHNTRPSIEEYAGSKQSRILPQSPHVRNIYDPSRYHPKYAYWRQRVGEVKLLGERIWNFRQREDKLRDRKEQREIVNSHLAKQDEEELQRLPGVIAKLMVELEESEEEIERLKEECLFLGIIGEDGEPVEKLTRRTEDEVRQPVMHSDESRTQQDDGENSPAFEVWVIIPARRNRSRKRTGRSRWVNSKEYKKNLSEKDIIHEMKKLDSQKRGALGERLAALTSDQLRQVKHICRERNKKEPDTLAPWRIGQVDWSHETIGSKQDGKKVSVIIVYLAKDLNPSSKRRQTPSSDDPDDQQDSTRSAAGTREASMTSVTSRHDMHSSTANSRKHSPEQSQQFVATTSPSHLEVHSSFEPLADVGHETKEFGENLKSQAASLISSAATDGYFDIHTEGPAHGGLQSRIGPWMFQMLAESRMEVRLLATILQAMGVPLLGETALLVLEYWASDVKDIKLQLSTKRAMLIIRQAGYDTALVHKVAEEPQAGCPSEIKMTCGDLFTMSDS